MCQDFTAKLKFSGTPLPFKDLIVKFLGVKVIQFLFLLQRVNNRLNNE